MGALSCLKRRECSEGQTMAFCLEQDLTRNRKNRDHTMC